jgi:hypothetical protein
LDSDSNLTFLTSRVHNFFCFKTIYKDNDVPAVAGRDVRVQSGLLDGEEPVHEASAPELVPVLVMK